MMAGCMGQHIAVHLNISPFPQVYWNAISHPPIKISWSHSVFNPRFLDSHEPLLSIAELRPNQPRFLATVSNLF